MPSLDQLPGNADVIICGHSSRAKLTEEEFSLIAADLQPRYPHLKIEYSSPNTHIALDSLLEQGVDQIYAVPGMLAMVGHGTSVARANAEAAKLARMVKNRHLNPKLIACLNASDHVNNNITHQRSSLPRRALTTTLEQK